MKSCVVRVPGPAVAKLTAPRELCWRTGSSGMRASRHTAATCGSPWIPNCAMKPVGAERRPVAVYLDHEVTCAGLEAGAERVRGALSHAGTRGVVKVRSPGGDWSGGRVRPGGRGARALAGAATQGRERKGDQRLIRHGCSVSGENAK